MFILIWFGWTKYFSYFWSEFIFLSSRTNFSIVFGSGLSFGLTGPNICDSSTLEFIPNSINSLIIIIAYVKALLLQDLSTKYCNLKK